MIGIIVWCMVSVTLETGEDTVTAMSGKIIDTKVINDTEYYVLDFSDYARRHKYKGEYYNKFLPTFFCQEDK